jgi:hypothetical protein
MVPPAGFACVGRSFKGKYAILLTGKGNMTAVPDSDLSRWHGGGIMPASDVIKYASSSHVNKIDRCHFRFLV